MKLLSACRAQRLSLPVHVPGIPFDVDFVVGVVSCIGMEFSESRGIVALKECPTPRCLLRWFGVQSFAGVREHAQSLSRKLRQAMFVASELVKNRNLQVKKIIENLLVNYKHAHIGCTEMQKYVDIRDLDRHFVCVVPAPAQCQVTLIKVLSFLYPCTWPRIVMR
ncbi:uncharacterized protein [Physcomitrium patens]|uniref:uncharacterized protein isoform X2 n=1 Tax=Physcomitrium patens TaxID=3218 RepID=UPI003CCD9CB3